MDTIEKVLIAEVKDIEAAHLKLMFKRRGYEVDIVKNGKDVLDEIEKTEYTLLVLNEKLSDIEGVEVVRKIRKKESVGEDNEKKLAIIGLTTYSLPAEKKQFQEAGLDYCLSKPVYKNKIINILSEITTEKKDNLTSTASSVE